MNSPVRRAAMAAAAAATAVSLAACGSGEPDDKGDEPKKGPLNIGLLLPEKETARYEKFDRPLIEERIKELAPGATVTYLNAEQDATEQKRQVNLLIAAQVDAIILGAVDTWTISSSVEKAEDEGIPVVAFDRLAEGPIDGYASFDNEEVGRVQGKALLEALGGTAKDGRIVMMNGAITDPNAQLFKKGAHSVLDGKVDIGKEYDTREWKPENAYNNMEAAATAIGTDRIIGVYSANDGMAGGVIDALKAVGVSKLPPVTGQDAELAAVQRIVAGEQFMSVYKPYAPEAAAAAEMAVALANGEKLDSIAKSEVDSPTKAGIPSVLVPVVSLTKDNIDDTVVKDGVYTVAEICTPKYRSACEALGLE
ncbi:substrate-binding domain-containing protein [Streptomyces sp. A3M-1-3]|uniref:sugar ABC transporter substrate-binding protein n=1 Tax=Streptomyces sp. A3M-1-3 TaxID=2962044 RepID=UPI0020B7043E|nr:substrate-binding domain-containing protein [Streptomyces sp. A3M-1-3]MCP3819714.1 substrate-binding domain-containing protein [Streptomyces sp. A3M-1-3]